MQNIKDSILFLLCLSVSLSQMFTGGLIPHLYTGTARPTISSGGAGRYSQTLDRVGIFDAGQQVHIGTSIIDFGYINTFGQSFTSSASVTYILKIALLNLALSSNGNVFSFDVQTKSSVATIDTKTYVVKTLGLNYIIIGEKTSGFYDDYSPPVPSTYIYAKNSQFLQLQTNQQLFSFKTGTDLKSPFNNGNPISSDVGCGAVKRTQGWFIERNCDLLIATLFITGFQLNIPNGQTVISSLNFKQVFQKQINLKTSSSAIFSSGSTAGISLSLAKNLATSAQLSMIILGIRQYNNIYPKQSIKIDDFKASTYISGLGYTFQTNTNGFNPASQPFNKDLTQDQKNNGHRFCGLNGLSHTVSTASYPKNPVGFKLSIDFSKYEFNLEIHPKQENSIINEINKQKINFKYTCLFLTSNKPCSLQSNYVTLTNLQLSSSSGKVTAQEISFPSTYPKSGDPFLISPNDKILGYLEQTFSDAASITYKFNVDPTSIKVGAYEGVLLIAGTGITGLDAHHNIRIRVFGTTILYSRKKVDNIQLYHFAFYNTNTNNQEIVITYEIQKSSTMDPTKIPAQRIQFGMIYHSKILTSAYECASLCPTITGKSTGIDYKTIPPQCIYCETSLNFEFDSLAGDCKCIDGFYKDISNPANPICKPCTIYNLCARCTSSSSKCEQCVSNALVDPNTKQCKCLVRNFYQSGNQCLPCPFGCQTCRSDTLCLTCVANSRTRQNPDQGCKCLAGYYEAGTQICPKCSIQCKTCKNADNICQSCADNGEVVGTTCKCKDGYYFGIVDGIGKCLKCHFSCKTCVQDAAKCLECPSKQWTKQDNRCICNKLLKYVYYSNVVIDSICVDRSCVEIDPNCVNCVILLESGNKLCSQCNEKQHWTLSPDNKACVCKFGFYLDQVRKSKCLPCSPGCQTCTSQTSCSQCALGSNSNKNGGCSCNAGYFVKQLSQGLICAPCDQNCANCVKQPNFCSECINGFKSQNNKCICKQGNYETADGINCLPCQPGCQKCSNAFKCDKCGSGYLTSEDGQKCIYNCPVGTYTVGSSCQKCSEGCKSCTNFINCKYCQEGLLNYLGSCRISCPIGTLSIGNTCIACSPMCLSCSLNPNNCTDCPSNSVRHNNQCVQSCPDKTFYNGINCVPCVPPCVTCISESKCKSCPPNQYLYQQKCYTTCPTALVYGICTDICAQGTFLAGKSCTNCNTQCKTCISFNNCTSCKGGLLVYSGSCVQSCPKNTLLAGPVCLDCDPSCNGCSGTTASCIECKANFYRLRDKCYSFCPESYYPQLSSKSCKNCDSKCKICSGPGQCSVCMDGKAPTGGLCEVQCGANCLECRNSICLKCAQSYYWTGTSCQNICPSQSSPSGNQCVCSSNLIMHLGSCIFSCPQGYTKINNQCKICNSPCKTCQKTSTTCTSCIDGYVLDAVNKKCSQKTSCPQGQYRSHFGQCKYICQAGTYYLDSICYYGRCPSGYQYDDQRRICTKQNPLTGCCQPYFLQGSVCVNNCDPGFYPDLDTRICTCCPINCLSCTGPQKCTSCTIGSILTGNICTINPDGCPSNQYRFNEICVSFCPSGTFNKNGFCIKLCNPGLYFWNGGCYQSCPTNLCTPDACIVVCPVGYTKSGTKCLPSLISCKAGQFFNAAFGICQNCRYPCASCAGSSSYCTSCVNGFSVKSGSCFNDASCSVGTYPSPSGCLRCHIKCSTCSDLNVCTSCANGYVNTGADCIQTTTNLQAITLQIVSIVRKDLIILIQIQVSILPNQLAGNLMSQILLFVPNIPNPCAKVNIWIQNNFIYVALSHEKSIPSYQTLLIFNSNLLDSIYRSMGYSTANAFCQASISSNIQLSNININIPYTVMNSRTFSNRQIQRVYNSRLNRESMKALSNNERAV